MRAALFAIVLVLASVLSPAMAQAPEPGTVLVILDGSGSMWGKPDGEAKTKLVLARDGLRAALAKAAPESRIGLMSYGHRRGGDCGDVETLIKPEAGSLERISAALEKHNPRGRGPITQALREAARELGPQSAPAHIVLVHDDLDNCQADPCSAIGDLRRAHPKVAVHVVSLGMRREDAQRMSCLATQTGGTMSVAVNAPQAAAAFETVAKALAAKAAPETLKSSAVAVKEPSSARPATPGLHLSAALAAGGAPVATPVRWRVTPEGKPGAAPVFEGDQVAPSLQLPAGKYEIEAQLGFVLARTSLALAKDEARSLTVALGGGTIMLMSAASDLPGIRNAVISFIRTDTAPEANSVAMMRGLPTEVTLTPGNYRISIVIGAARIERTVTVALGQRQPIAPLLDFGELDLAAIPAAGGQPVDSVLFTVSEDDPDSPRGRREVIRSATPQPRLVLPPGAYVVVARAGTTEVRERVAIKSGERIERSLILGTGRLNVSATLPGKLESKEPISIKLDALDESRTAKTDRGTAIFDVTAGRYRIEARAGRTNAAVSRDIEIKPGARDQLTLDIPAGRLQLRLIDPQRGAPLQDVTWDIRDQADRSIWSGQQAEAAPLLLQGRYRVRAILRGREFARDVEVRTGETRSYDIVGSP